MAQQHPIGGALVCFCIASAAETSWNNVNTRAWIAGEVVWTRFDYIGEPAPYEWPAKSSYFGIIETANFPPR